MTFPFNKKKRQVRDVNRNKAQEKQAQVEEAQSQKEMQDLSRVMPREWVKDVSEDLVEMPKGDEQCTNGDFARGDCHFRTLDFLALLGKRLGKCREKVHVQWVETLTHYFSLKKRFIFISWWIRFHNELLFRLFYCCSSTVVCIYGP